MFNRLEFRLLRGSSQQVAEFLKNGEAELGVAAEIDEAWEQLDTWPLFTEPFQLLINRRHPFADRNSVTFGELQGQQWLLRNYCEHAEQLSASLRACGVDLDHSHGISSERDLIELLEAEIGVAVIPHSVSTPNTLKRADLDGLDVRRTVRLYGVAGRERTAVASAVMRMLRGADWSQYRDQ